MHCWNRIQPYWLLYLEYNGLLIYWFIRQYQSINMKCILHLPDGKAYPGKVKSFDEKTGQQSKKLTHSDVPSLASHSISFCPCPTCLLRMMDIIISVIDVLLPYLKLKWKTIWHLVSLNSISCGMMLHILLPVVLGYLKKNVFSVPINKDVCQVASWNIWAVVNR